MTAPRGDTARPPAPPLSPEEAATLARFDAAAAAPESFDSWMTHASERDVLADYLNQHPEVVWEIVVGPELNAEVPRVTYRPADGVREPVRCRADHAVWADGSQQWFRCELPADHLGEHVADEGFWTWEDRPAPTARERIRLALLDDGWQSHHADRACDALLAPGGPVAVIVAEALRGAAKAWRDESAEHYYDTRHSDAGTSYAAGYEAGWDHAADLAIDRADAIEREGIR